MHGHLATASTLSLRLQEDYIQRAGQPAMAINVLWNKRNGPGGSARRLHHKLFADSTVYGGETGSTCVVKALLSFGMVPPISGRFYKC